MIKNFSPIIVYAVIIAVATVAALRILNPVGFNDLVAKVSHTTPASNNNSAPGTAPAQTATPAVTPAPVSTAAPVTAPATTPVGTVATTSSSPSPSSTTEPAK